MPLQFTAVYREVPEGHISCIEELFGTGFIRWIYVVPVRKLGNAEP